MRRLSLSARSTIGLRAARTQMFRQDKVWSRYSNDKVDIAHHLARVLRVLAKSLPLERPLRALSIGSSNEPQFRILESAFRGGLYLLDIEAEALNVVRERIRRQATDHVYPIRGDYRMLLGDRRRALRFRARALGGHRMTLVTLHHSLYYSPEASWLPLVTALYRDILARPVDPAGSQTWGAALAGGMGRDAVAQLVLTSGEARQDLIESYYEQYLHRAADQGGLNTWVGQLTAGVPDAAIFAGILGSDEAFQWL